MTGNHVVRVRELSCPQQVSCDLPHMCTQNKFKKIKEELDKEVWDWEGDVAKERNCIDVGWRGGGPYHLSCDQGILICFLI